MATNVDELRRQKPGIDSLQQGDKKGDS
jgi:hypothetical protein